MKFLDYLNRDKKSSIISKGLKINNNFWDDFQKILNNSDEISILLDVPKTKVVTWKKKIQDAVKNHNKENQSINKKTRIIKTGKLY